MATDPEWLRFLRERPHLQEVNFWRPRATAMNETQGTPVLYKLRGGSGEIVGCGFFAACARMPLSMAWSYYGEANGFSSFEAFRTKIGRLRNEAATSITEIGCAALVEPVYFQRPIDGDRMFGAITSGETLTASGAALWAEVQARIDRPDIYPQISTFAAGSSGYGAMTLVKPRLGQASFRTGVLGAYERRCAITGERTVPALEAAHIRPFRTSEDHSITNGLLLRSDLHALYDYGLVTVDADYRLHVSSQIAERYMNGREYYKLDGTSLRAPARKELRPSPESLDWHAKSVFKP